MTRKISLLSLALIVFISCSAQKKEEKAVRKSFDDYKSAILNDKGEEAVNYVDSRTISYYSEILNTTINADSLTVNSLVLMDKLMVLIIRHKTTKEDILSFDGRGLLIYAIDEGMVGKNSVANSIIGEVKIDGDFAKGQLIANEQKTPIYYHFYKEKGEWKIDLTSIFSIGTMAFKKMVDESGQEENEYLYMLLEMSTGKKPSADIWKQIE